MWTSVYMAQCLEKANELRNSIEENGIIVMLKKICVADNSENNCYEILVPRAELEKALEIIIAA